MAAVVAWVRNHRGSPLLVEGVGGFAVPIDRHNTVADLAAQLALPVLVVAANRLGVLNHTLLSIQAIRAANLTIAGLVLNNAASPPSALQQWNADDLRQRIGADIPIATIEQGSLPGDLVNMGESILSQLGH
jgi:dethiobiotin synthetase